MQKMRARALALLLVPLAGCVTVIRPPASPEDPVPVVVVDYGYHSSLVLPRPEGGSVEYAYGEWDWFALNQDRWYNAFGTLLWPNQGALGRRQLAADATADALKGGVRCEELFEFPVARSRAEALRGTLEGDFRKRIDTRVFNPVNELEFVHGEDSYCALVNCNHILARWLRELGCEVGGSACFSSWRIDVTK